MTKRMIICIGREFGSGGKEISIKLAKKLGIPCYDESLLTITAKNSGMDRTIVKNLDESSEKPFMYAAINNSYALKEFSDQGFSEVLPISHKVFLAQFDTIRELAKKSSCIFVGRCADYVLEKDPDVCSIFIHASDEFRLSRVGADNEDLKGTQKLLDKIHKMDKKRSSYYNYYSGKKWGYVGSYDLCIDSSKMGIDKTVDVILSYLKIRFPEES